MIKSKWNLKFRLFPRLLKPHLYRIFFKSNPKFTQLIVKAKKKDWKNFLEYFSHTINPPCIDDFETCKQWTPNEICHIGNEDYWINFTIQEYFKHLMKNFPDADNSRLRIFNWFLKTPLGTWGVRHNSQVARMAMLGRFWPLAFFKKPSPEYQRLFPYLSYSTEINLVGKILVPKLGQFYQTSRVSFWTNTSCFFKKCKNPIVFEFVMTS